MLNESYETPLLSLYPPGTEIVSSVSYRPGYQEFPVRVGLRKPGGAIESCVIKLSSSLEALSKEAQVLQAVVEIGLAAPKVLLEPKIVEDGKAMMAMSVVPGRSLAWIALDSLNEANLTCKLLIEGIRRLHELTEPMQRTGIARSLPRVTLLSELNEVIHRGEKWLDIELFARMVEHLEGCVAEIGNSARVYQRRLQPSQSALRRQIADGLD